MRFDDAHVAVVGAGAMGCLFAAHLVESGIHVTLIDVDESRVKALAEAGLTLEDDCGTRTLSVSAGLASQISGTVDLVILFTKGVHSRAAIRSIAHLRGPDTFALTLQNGLGNADACAEVFAANRILIGVTDIPADLVTPIKVASHGKGQIWLGALDSAHLAFAQAAGELFTAAKFSCVVDPQVEIQIWEKVAFNAALNALATVSGLTVGGMDTQPGRRIIDSVVGEVISTALAQGLLLNHSRIKSKIAHALANHRFHKASMLQDRLAGRPSEIETINGAIERAGAASGVPTPVTSTLADLVRLLERPAIS